MFCSECIQEIPLDLGRVGLVGMDIQGHEGHMLAGAYSLTERTIPVDLEYWPYGLRRSDGLTLLHELIARHYSEFIDVRASMHSGRTVAFPAEEIGQLTKSYPRENWQGSSVTIAKRPLSSMRLSKGRRSAKYSSTARRDPCQKP